MTAAIISFTLNIILIICCTHYALKNNHLKRENEALSNHLFECEESNDQLVSGVKKLRQTSDMKLKAANARADVVRVMAARGENNALRN